jgi:hypothetical protein
MFTNINESEESYKQWQLTSLTDKNQCLYSFSYCLISGMCVRDGILFLLWKKISKYKNGLGNAIISGTSAAVCTAVVVARCNGRL